MTRNRLPILLFVLAGCAAPSGPSPKPGVVRSTGNDSVEFLLEAPMDSVREAAVAVIETNGRVVNSEPAQGKLRGDVEGADVKLNLVPLSEESVQVRVRVRRDHGFAPDADTAKDVARGIIRRVGD